MDAKVCAASSPCGRRSPILERGDAPKTPSQGNLQKEDFEPVLHSSRGQPPILPAPAATARIPAAPSLPTPNERFKYLIKSNLHCYNAMADGSARASSSLESWRGLFAVHRFFQRGLPLLIFRCGSFPRRIGPFFAISKDSARTPRAEGGERSVERRLHATGEVLPAAAAKEAQGRKSAVRRLTDIRE